MNELTDPKSAVTMKVRGLVMDPASNSPVVILENSEGNAFLPIWIGVCEANAIAPRKRPLSSMTPAILFRDGKPVLATGSPGGPVIITAVLQTLLNVIDFEMNVAEASRSSLSRAMVAAAMASKVPPRQ